MITVYPVLRQQMKEHGTTAKELATITNSNIFALYLKMWGIKRWKLTDALRICCFFRTQDVERMFEKKRLFSYVRKYYSTNSNKSQ